MSKTTQICEGCEEPIDKCICCDGCGHTCMLDFGEPYCPVCFPEPRKQPDE